MGRRIHPDLQEVAAAVEVESATRYTFRGEPRDLAAMPFAPVSETGRPVKLSGDEATLTAILESELYQRLYRRPADGVGRSVVQGGADHGFIEQLSAANAGNGTWQAGWKVAEVEPGGWVGVARDAVCYVEASQVRPLGGPLQPGLPCRVRVPKEVRHLVLGYYLALGDEEMAESDAGRGGLVRLYWNLAADAAPVYLRRLTARLNRDAIPFRTKVIGHPALYQNTDAGVLYLARDDYARALPAIREVLKALADGLRPEVPMFTKRLAPGLGLAEDPLDGSSFGQSRCRLAARALLRNGRGAPGARAKAVAGSFQREGLDPDHPYLRAGSEDVYDLP